MVSVSLESGGGELFQDVLIGRMTVLASPGTMAVGQAILGEHSGAGREVFSQLRAKDIWVPIEAARHKVP